MSQPIVYCIPGLGANEGMWANQEELPLEFRHIKMVAPKHPKMTMAEYATQLMEQIDTEGPINLMGVSMGGMLAVEIAKQIETRKVLAISSSKTANELPPPIRWIGKTFLPDLLPAKWFKRILKWYANKLTNLTEDYKILYGEMVDSLPDAFVHWAAKGISRWNNETVPKTVFHIHGTHDKVLPYQFVQADVSIPGARHYMIALKADVLNPMILEQFTVLRKKEK
ncbi:MAG: alpha/beta hydrolase [Bacteroidota bacterium]